MRFTSVLVSLLLCLLACNAQAVVAPDDNSEHDSIQFILDHRVLGEEITPVDREQLDRLSTSFNLVLNKGFKVAAIIWPSVPRVVYAKDTPLNAPLVYLIGRDGLGVNAAIYQDDQTKVLSDPKDTIDPSCYGGDEKNANPAAPGGSAHPVIVNLPEGMRADAKDPDIIHADSAAMLTLAKSLGLNAKPGFHLGLIQMELPATEGGGTVSVILDGFGKKVIGLEVATKRNKGGLRAVIVRDDGTDIDPNSTIPDVLSFPSAKQPVTP